MPASYYQAHPVPRAQLLLPSPLPLPLPSDCGARQDQHRYRSTDWPADPHHKDRRGVLIIA